ncbi:MAG: response regulator [Solirubrobacteraceae bacterium]
MAPEVSNTVPSRKSAPESSSAAPARTVGVLVVDDQPLFLGAIRRVVEATAGFAIVGEATSGERAVALADALRPDLVLMDVRMPGLGGVEATRRITTARTASAVVLVSCDPQNAPPECAEACGAVGVLGKERLGPSSLRALWEGCRGPG